MKEKNAVQDILKQAIIMESRAKALYSKVSELSPHEGARRIFGVLAKEEQLHIDFLMKQYEHFQKNQQFANFEADITSEVPQLADLVISQSLKEEISGAGFEAAAISAAIDMENKTVAAYLARANDATDPAEKAFYIFLANWEKDHHKLLVDLNRELTEKIWYDNQFWPF